MVVTGILGWVESVYLFHQRVLLKELNYKTIVNEHQQDGFWRLGPEHKAGLTRAINESKIAGRVKSQTFFTISIDF